jgi:hypothetical protein
MTDLEAVRAALAEAEAKLADVEAAAPAAALRVHTGRPQEGDADILAGLGSLRSEVDQLRLALVAAEAAEAERQAVARYREDQSRQRALAQKFGAMRRAAEKISRAVVDLHGAFQDLCENAQGASVLLPRQMGHQPWQTASELSAHYLGRLVRAEITRHDLAASARIFDQPVWLEDLKRGDGQVRTFLSIVTEKVDGLKGQAASYAVKDPEVPVIASSSAVADGGGEAAVSRSAVAPPAAELPEIKPPTAAEPEPVSSPTNPLNVIDRRGLGPKPAEPVAEESV